ncbi:MAG: response regulator [bacterium]|nr:response regulator [bacterium]
MKILVVDDTLLARQLMSHALRPYGDVDVVVNGEEALEVFKSSLKEKTPYSVIFLDIMMPEMDGHEALRQIRQWEDSQGIKEPVPVVMTTALGDKENILSSFKEGCEHYLVKPIELAKLFNIMTELGFSKSS